MILEHSILAPARNRGRFARALILSLALVSTAGCGRVEGSRLLGTWCADTGKGTATAEARKKSPLPELTFGSDGTCTAESFRGDDAKSATSKRDERRWQLVEDRGDRYVVRFTSPKSGNEWLVTCIFADDDHVELVEREGNPGMKYQRVD
jgi:hypothetical protein